MALEENGDAEDQADDETRNSPRRNVRRGRVLHELPAGQRLALTREFARQLADRYGGAWSADDP